MKKHIVWLLFAAVVYSNQCYAYRIGVKNELDGPITVNITEGKVTTPRSVRPGDRFDYITTGCYVLSLKVDSGRAVGQSGGLGNDFSPACRDYKVIARFLISPFWDPITAKQNLVPTIMELREE